MTRGLSHAFSKKDPVFPVDGNLYGMPAADFDLYISADITSTKLASHANTDIDTSIYDFVKPDFREFSKRDPSLGSLDATRGRDTVQSVC